MTTFLVVLAFIAVLYFTYKHLKAAEVVKRKREEKFIARTKYTNSERMRRSLEELDELNKRYNENPRPISRSMKNQINDRNTLYEKKKEDAFLSQGINPIFLDNVFNDNKTSFSSSIVDFGKDTSDESFGHGGSFGGGGASASWDSKEPDTHSTESSYDYKVDSFPSWSSDSSDSSSSDSSSYDSGSSDSGSCDSGSSD